MKSILLSIYLLILFFLVCCPVDMLHIPEQDILDVYNKYREAAGDETRRSASKRFSKNNMDYQIHVERLKGVNGYKAHNLIIRSGIEPGTNKTMYINNPLESKMPQAYLTLDEFKQALMNRVKKNNTTLEKAKLKAKILRLWKMKRKGGKFTESHRVHSGKSKKSHTKKHRSQIIPNPLLDDFKVNITISTKANISDISTKEQNKTKVTQVLDITKNIAFNKTETTISYRNPIQLPNQNATEDISEMSAQTTTSNKQDKIIEETVTEVDLNLETTDAETTKSEVTETTITEESTTVETMPPTTVPRRITLGRPAVYMGDVD